MRLTDAVPAGACALALAAVAATVQERPAPKPSPLITVTGCVRRESEVLKRDPARPAVAPDVEFVLTFGRLNSTDLSAPPEASAAPDMVGTVYRLTGSKEREMKEFVGQRIQVTGSFKDQARAAAAMRSSPANARTGELTQDNTPEIVIDTYKIVSEVCSPPVK